MSVRVVVLTRNTFNTPRTIGVIILTRKDLVNTAIGWCHLVEVKCTVSRHLAHNSLMENISSGTVIFTAPLVVIVRIRKDLVLQEKSLPLTTSSWDTLAVATFNRTRKCYCDAYHVVRIF